MNVGVQVRADAHAGGQGAKGEAQSLLPTLHVHMHVRSTCARNINQNIAHTHAHTHELP